MSVHVSSEVPQVRAFQRRSGSADSWVACSRSCGNQWGWSLTDGTICPAKPSKFYFELR